MSTYFNIHSIFLNAPETYLYPWLAFFCLCLFICFKFMNFFSTHLAMSHLGFWWLDLFAFKMFVQILIMDYFVMRVLYFHVSCTSGVHLSSRSRVCLLLGRLHDAISRPVFLFGMHFISWRHELFTASSVTSSLSPSHPHLPWSRADASRKEEDD